MVNPNRLRAEEFIRKYKRKYPMCRFSIGLGGMGVACYKSDKLLIVDYETFGEDNWKRKLIKEINGIIQS